MWGREASRPEGKPNSQLLILGLSPKVLSGMFVKRLFATIAVAAMLFLQVQSCMAQPMSSQQDMQCCKSMRCTSANNGQDCCKRMVSPNVPTMLPVQQASLKAPAIVVVHYPSIIDLAGRFSSPLSEPIHAQQHSPPELYTLYATLLI